jgi:hypothetical protein
MGITVDEAKALMDAETWYLGQEAVDAGYADATYEGSKATASFDVSRFTAKTPKAVIERFTQQSPSEETPMANEPNEPQENESPVDDVAATDTGAANETQSSNEPVAAVVDVKEAVQQALANERMRTAEITQIGERFGFMDSAKDFIQQGKEVDAFRQHVLSKSPEEWRESLSVQNASAQSTEIEIDDNSEAVSEQSNRIKERRRARMGIA